ncbi:MAG: hypothetical protein F6K32_16295 [Desertifilum sp. SIO1I2]|nr:hypothetical protein [Desertifilum sp. SIO1I2]
MNFAFCVPQEVSFENAIALTQSLLEQFCSRQLTPSQLTEAVTALVQTENGARGFFVTYLTRDRQELADIPNDAIVEALKTSPEIVAELLVKNLAMSAAMEISHQRRNDPQMVAGSQQVQRRSAELLQHLSSPEIQQKLQALLTNLETGSGSYQAFLERWGYDSEQKSAIRQAIPTEILQSKS